MNHKPPFLLASIAASLATMIVPVIGGLFRNKIGTLLTKLNKSDEGSKDRVSERREYPPGRGRIIPASQQRPVCVRDKWFDSWRNRIAVDYE